MIRSFGDRRTRRFVEGETIKEFRMFRDAAETRLSRLNAAATLQELAVPPGNRLEALRGDRKGQWSIRINDQWRICFRWNEQDGCAEDVVIVDYH